jgi:hypothetical protein
MPETSALTSSATATTTTIAPIESPPPSAQPLNPSSGDDARGRLHRLAMQLIRTQNRRLLAEFLTLRRAMR